MTTCPDAMQHFFGVGREVLGTDECFVGYQPSPFNFPSVVFYAVGQDTLTTLRVGPHQVATAIRFDVRSKRQRETVDLSAGIVSALRKGGRLLALQSLVDDYDDELRIYRRIRSVMLR